MVHNGDYNINVDTDTIPLSLTDWESKYFMKAPLTLCIREPNDIESKSLDPDTPTYMEELSGEYANEYYKAMYDEIQILTRRDTWEIVPRKSVADQNVLIGTWYFR